MNEFWNWWQHLPSKMNPIVFEIGPLNIQYYGLMYLVAFAFTYFLVIYRIKREERFDVSVEQIQNLTTVMIIGLIIGARLGYVLFYNFSYYIRHPLEIFLPFDFENIRIATSPRAIFFSIKIPTILPVANPMA